ncbi:uncharacterized protein LOC129595179 [Paramacrobiotus metropolitanus]|uniref:uncharacterized protein LOC129595179 n=1 Tax=Paramacrobiotus metropolitanus TaxID=2943436 RepID=UPI00244656CE|nr:uncharacterized protein LOC129595179 [Paramacrobiotus metropolitanus]
MNALYYRNYFEILNTSFGTPPAVILGAKYGSNYLASQSSNSINGSNNVARIMSRPITSAMPYNTQVTFWYNIAAYQLRYFRLIVRQNEVDEIVWERSGGSAPGWKEAVLTVCGKAGAHLILEVAFTLPDSVVAVDDVRYRGENNLAASVPGLCPVVSCHFEDGFCGWLSDIRAAPFNNRWVRSTSRIDYHDHPNNGKSGRFHVQSTGIPNQALSIARLYTPCLAVSSDSSLDFFVHLYGPSIQYVQLKSLSNAANNETVLWSSSSVQSNAWLHPTLPVPASTNVVFILEAAFSDADSTVAIDQIRLLNEAEVVTLGDNCPGVAPVTPATTRPTRPTVTTPVPPLPTGTLSCSFNSHFCGYGYQGFRISNTSEDITTSVGGGMALFQPNSQQRHANLLSRGFYVRERMQVFFFYFAHADVETFTVKAHYVVNGQITSTDVLFELHGSAALGGMAFGRWIPGRVTLCVPGFSPLVQLEFSVTAGAGSSSEFALDEIIINRETQATSLTPLNSTLDCGPINRPNSLTCEDIAPGAPFCGWQAPPGVTTQVLPGTHETALVVLGEALSAGPVQVVSGEIPPHSEPTNFAFKYMLVTRARLQVDLLVGGDNSLPYPLAPTENAERWNSAVVEVPASDQPSRITFRVSVLEVQNRQEPGVVPALFALTDTWYSAEEGFVAQLDNVTTTVSPVTTEPTATSGSTVTSVTTGPTGTAGSTTTSGPTVTSVTSESPTPTTVPTTNATTPPIVVRPTSAPQAYSTQDIVLISVGSVAGALVLLGVVIALLHLRSKRRERQGRSYEEHVVTETPLTEMSTRTSTMSKPPAYSSKPPTPPPASGQSTPPPSQPTVAAFRTKGFDEETL